MKKSHLIFLSAIALSSTGLASAAPSPADTLTLEPGKYGDYSLRGFKYLTSVDSPETTYISARQLTTWEEKLSFQNDTIYIGSNIVVNEEEIIRYGEKLSGRIVFPWLTEGKMNYVILGPEATRLPIYNLHSITPSMDYEDNFCRPIWCFATPDRKDPELDIEINCRKFDQRYSYMEYRNMGYTVNNLIIGKTCEEFPGRYFESMKKIIVRAQKIPKLSESFTWEIYNNVPLIVPDGLVPLYAADPDWGLFKTIIDESGSTDRGDTTNDYEFGDENYNDWWTFIPLSRVWTPSSANGRWQNYDYVYIDKNGLISYDQHDAGNPHTYKNTIFNIDGDMDVKFLQTDPYNLEGYPVKGFDKVKELVFGEHLQYYPSLSNYPLYEYMYTVDGGDVLPIYLYPDKKYTLRYNCSRLISKYDDNNYDDYQIAPLKPWSSYIDKLIIGSKCTEISFCMYEATEIISEAQNPPVIKEVFNRNQYKNASVTVPVGSLERYREAPGWCNFVNIHEGETNGIHDVCVSAEELLAGISVSGGILTIAEGVNPLSPVEIYGIDGSLIYRGKERSIKVPAGILIVKYAGETRKIIN